MLQLPDTHPDYCLDTEVLATLPKDPNSAPLHLLAEDFGPCVHGSLVRLRDMGWRIHLDGKVGMISACIDEDCWGECQTIAQNYWDTVHNNGF